MDRPRVTSFFDEATNTASHVVSDPETGTAAIVDPVLDFDPASGRTGTGAADAVIDHLAGAGLTVASILETHVHADHLSAAAYLKRRVGGTVAIGRGIVDVQQRFAPLFNLPPAIARDGSQFDRLLDDGETIHLGRITGRALATPGHTPACMTFVFGDAAFVGDTLFMPDFGTARSDFPGGDAAQLYRSIRRIFDLPAETRLFLCHDYKAPGRDAYSWETTVAAERGANIHVRDDIGEAAFVAMRRARDATLSVPRLLLPSIQVNMLAGALPDAEDNGTRYLKLPIDAFP